MGGPAITRVYEGLPREVESSLRPLFDQEYLNDFGSWDSRNPYGYSPFDVHVVAYVQGIAVGHVGFQRRQISVGRDTVLVAGTGGVLVAPEQRGSGLGRRLLARAREAMRDTPAVDFGYLGCREEVADFYAASGWMRIRVDERSVPRSEHTPVLHPAGPPIMICSARSSTNEWPNGTVDLQGKAW